MNMQVVKMLEAGCNICLLIWVGHLERLVCEIESIVMGGCRL